MFVFDIECMNLINLSNIDTMGVFEAQTGAWEIRAYGEHGSWILGTFKTKMEAQARLVIFSDYLNGETKVRSEKTIITALERLNDDGK
jgi:hypothetical protein